MKLRMIKLGIWSPPASVRLGKYCVVALALGMALALSSVAGQIVDRVVTSVNGHVVLQSDWEQELAIEAFSNARDPDSFTSAERNAALDRLIDQQLLREQVRPSESAPAEPVTAPVGELRKLHPECATDEGWRATLQRHGLTQKSLEKSVGDQIQLMKLVEDRLQPSIQIDQRAVETYYHDQLLPDMKRAGSPPAPLTEVFGQIKDLLAERRMNELLAVWLANLRSGSRILTPESGAGERTR